MFMSLCDLKVHGCTSPPTHVHVVNITLVESKWRARFLRQASISDTLDDLNARLDDASQSFQVESK
jgi:hypothetical protein